MITALIAIIMILAALLAQTMIVTAVEEKKPEYTVPKGRYDKYLFVGDSRFVGMSAYCKDENTEYFAKTSQGLKWFKQNYDSITTYRNYNIVINLGVNDLYNCNRYVDIYNNFPKEFTDNNNIIIVSVNPCQGKHAYLNKDIVTFNDTIKEGIPAEFEYIDTYDYLNNKGFNTTDGLHYDKATYQNIYDAIINGF